MRSLDIGANTRLRDAVAVIHLAGLAHRAVASHEELRAVNVDATARLARAAAAQGVRHFVFASSVKVNGETSLPGPSFIGSWLRHPYAQNSRVVNFTTNK